MTPRFGDNFNYLDGHFVPGIGTHAPPVLERLPQLDLGVHTTGEEEMGRPEGKHNFSR